MQSPETQKQEALEVQQEETEAEEDEQYKIELRNKAEREVIQETLETSKAEELDRLRGEIFEKKEGGDEEERELVDSLRLPRHRGGNPVPLTPEERELISETVSATRDNLALTYHKGFGIFPSAGEKENFYSQVYARDSAHAAGNYFAEANPEAMKDFLATLLKHQREDGALPLRVEKEYQRMKLVPGLAPLARPAFNLVHERILGKKERPVYEGGDMGASGSEDTVPATLIAAGEFFVASKEGREFVKDNFDALKRAADYFRSKTDKEDGLAVITRDNPDWADSLKRKGKLGGINVWWARSLRMMEFVANQLGRKEDAQRYKREFQEVKKSALTKLYNSEEGYFRAKEGEDRIDTVASVFGALYLLSPEEAVKVEETLEKRVRHNSGLTNFDPPYPREEIFGTHKMWSSLASMQKKWGMQDYHNRLVWPWVTCENIQVKIKIALHHRDEAVREKYKKEAADDLLQMSEIFKKAGGAYEVLDPDKPEHADISLYASPKNFMGTMAAYQGAYRQMESLGWLPEGTKEVTRGFT